MGERAARLDEFDREEWRTITRRLWPKGWTDADFDAAWSEFAAMKARKALQ